MQRQLRVTGPDSRGVDRIFYRLEYFSRSCATGTSVLKRSGLASLHEARQLRNTDRHICSSIRRVVNLTSIDTAS